MGVVILAGDDKEFRVGDYIVMHNQITSPPTAPDTTYILHTRKFSESDILEWSPIVKYRLVVILPKLPTLTKKSEDVVIVHRSLRLGKESWSPMIDAMLRWSDRRRALPRIQQLPIPLAISAWRTNRPDDIRTARLLAAISFTLPDEYAHAVLCLFVKPDRSKVKWAKKKKHDELPSSFRSTDAYCVDLIKLAPAVANHIRATEPSALPKGVKKRPEVVSEWL
jgi:hypothetical protein